MPAHVKTSLAPGSKVVTGYLRESGLLTYLEQLGFYVVGYGCTTCIGNSGPLLPEISEASLRMTCWYPRYFMETAILRAGYIHR